MTDPGQGGVIRALTRMVRGKPAGGAKMRSLEEALDSVLASQKRLPPSTLARLRRDIAALFEDFAGRNGRRLHLRGKPPPLEELADLRKAGGLDPATPAAAEVRSAEARQPSKSKLRVLEDKLKYDRLTALVNDPKLPPKVREHLKQIVKEYFGNAGLLETHRARLSFFFSDLPFGRWSNPDLLAVFNNVRKVKTEMWALLRQQGLDRPNFLQGVGQTAARRAARRARLIVDSADNAADRARAEQLWKRIGPALDAATPAAPLNATVMQDMVALIHLAGKQADGMNAVRAEMRDTLREQFGAMRQRWLDEIMSPGQAGLKKALEDIGFKFKTHTDPRWGRRIYIEIAHGQMVVRMGLDLDHASVGFAEARDRFIEDFLTNKKLSPEALKSIFDPDNLQPMSPLENSGVIGTLRRDLEDLKAGASVGRALSKAPGDLLKAGQERMGKIADTMSELQVMQQEAKHIAALRAEVLKTRRELDLLPDGPDKEKFIRDFEEANLFLEPSEGGH